MMGLVFRNCIVTCFTSIKTNILSGGGAYSTMVFGICQSVGNVQFEIKNTTATVFIQKFD